MTKQFTDDNFKTEVLGNDQLTMVDFWAEWCGPCRALGPVVDELSQEYEGKVSIGKLNTDTNSVTSMEYGITSIPALLFFKNGEIVEKIVGAQPKYKLKEKIDSLI